MNTQIIKTKLLLVLVCAVLFSTLNTGCSLFDASDTGELIAEIEAPSTLLLHNTTGRTVSYFVGDEDVMALMDIKFDKSSWPTIGAGQTADVPFDEIPFYSEETQRL
jgi:predicted membrane protein